MHFTYYFLLNFLYCINEYIQATNSLFKIWSLAKGLYRHKPHIRMNDRNGSCFTYYTVARIIAVFEKHKNKAVNVSKPVIITAICE